jgi:hypothetical protein
LEQLQIVSGTSEKKREETAEEKEKVEPVEDKGTANK